MSNVSVLHREENFVVAMVANKRRVLVVKDSNYLILVSPVLKVMCTPFVPLAKVGDKDTIDDFYRLLGKISMKPESSKYFDNPKFGEHLINGNVPESNYIEVATLAERACEIYEDFFKDET